MAMVMFAKTVILHTCVIKICIILTLTFRIWVKDKLKYANCNSLCDFILDGNKNIDNICHSLRDIHCRNVPDLDLDH